MRLHLASNTAIISRPPAIPAVSHGGRLFYYASPHVHVVDLQSGCIVHKLEYEDVQLLGIHGGRLYICTSDVYILDMERYGLVDVVRLSKSLVNRIQFLGGGAPGAPCRWMVSKVNNRVLVFEGLRRVGDLFSSSPCDALLMDEHMYGYLDKETLVVHDSSTAAVLLSRAVEDVVAAFLHDGGVYTVDCSGALKEWLSGREVGLQGLRNEITGGYFADGLICVSDGQTIYECDMDGSLLGARDLRSLVAGYSGTVAGDGVDVSAAGEPGAGDEPDKAKRAKTALLAKQAVVSHEEDSIDDENSIGDEESIGDEDSTYRADEENSSGTTDEADVADGPSGATDADSDSAEEPEEIEYLNNSLIATGNSIILHERLAVTKIISFNDDVTNAILYRGFLLLSTSGGQLRYTAVSRYCRAGGEPGGPGRAGDGREYVFDGRVLQLHGDSINSMALLDDWVLTGSRDRTCVLWRVSVDENGLLGFCRTWIFRGFLEPVSAVALNSGVAAMASLDNILHLYRCELGAAGGPRIEPLSVQRAHAKQINHILATPSLIVTCSSDKSAKVFSLSGELLKTIASDRVLHSSFGPGYLAVCSHRSIKIYTSGASDAGDRRPGAERLAEHCSFQTKRPVLSSCFLGEHFIAVSDVVRIYDLASKKCVKSYDFGLVSCWSLDFPVLCAENKIVFLEDESARVNGELLSGLRVLREESLLLDRHCREHNYREALSIMIRKNDYRGLFRVICDGYYSQRDLGFMDVFCGLKSKVLELLLKNPGVKQSEVFNLIVSRELAGCPDPGRRGKILDICRKHFSAVDQMYTDLAALDIYEQ